MHFAVQIIVCWAIDQSTRILISKQTYRNNSQIINIFRDLLTFFLSKHSGSSSSWHQPASSSSSRFYPITKCSSASKPLKMPFQSCAVFSVWREPFQRGDCINNIQRRARIASFTIDSWGFVCRKASKTFWHIVLTLTAARNLGFRMISLQTIFVSLSLIVYWVYELAQRQVTRPVQRRCTGLPRSGFALVTLRRSRRRLYLFMTTIDDGWIRSLNGGSKDGISDEGSAAEDCTMLIVNCRILTKARQRQRDKSDGIGRLAAGRLYTSEIS